MSFEAIGGELAKSIEIYQAIARLCKINIQSELSSVMKISTFLDKLPESFVLHLKKRRFGAWNLKKQHDGTLELIVTNCPFWGVSNKNIHQPRLLCRRHCDRFIRLLKHKYNVIETY